MAEKYFDVSVINNWTNYLTSINNDCKEIRKTFSRQRLNVGEIKVYVSFTFGEDNQIGGVNAARWIGDALISYNNNIYRPEMTEFYSFYNKLIIKTNSILNTFQSSPTIQQHYKAVSNIVLNNIQQLKNNINVQDIPEGELVCVDEKSKPISMTGVNWMSAIDISLTEFFEGMGLTIAIDAVTNAAKMPRRVELRTNMPDITAKLNNVKQNLQLFDTNLFSELSGTGESTGINLNNRDTKELINTANRLNETSDSSAIVVNEDNQANEQYLVKIVAMCNDLLSLCHEIVVDTTNIIFNMNVRFRNITLPDNQDSVYNLSQWLYAFQKQVMKTLYDIGEFVRQINENQRTDSISLQAVHTDVLQIVAELTVINANIGTTLNAVNILQLYTQGAFENLVLWTEAANAYFININDNTNTIIENMDTNNQTINDRIAGIENKQEEHTEKLNEVENLCNQILDRLN